MYEAGNYIVCRNGGIWRISQMDGNSCTLVEHESGIIKTISAGSDEIVRKIASKETILDAVDRVGYIRTIRAPSDKIRKEFYDEAMAKYDEIEWIKVIKTIYLRQKEKRLMPYEITYSGKAKDYLHGEISVLLEMPLNKVEDYITAAVARDSW